ncbi:helicase-related protein [Sphingopyxis sp. P8]|uniref:helicase-related protein n=1 Tax=Sphingopyxis sp. P8 TaxID=2763256 RepID=UPI001D0B8198|nr:helicase-related protein [Sphingopyxis sp. P8]
MVARLFEDLIGPRQENEKLQSRPSDVYLSGILWPMRSATPGEEDDKLEVGSTGRNEEASDGAPEEIPAKSVMRPSTAGVSFSLRSASNYKINVEVSFARYDKVIEDDGLEVWERTSVNLLVEGISCDGNSARIGLAEMNKTASGAELHVRAVDGPDCRLVTVTLINSNLSTAGRDDAESSTFFQTGLTITAGEDSALVPRPSGRGFQGSTGDEEAISNALLYRNVEEFAAGHTCSAEWSDPFVGANGNEVAFVKSTWMPSGVVPDVSSAGHAVFEELAAAGGAGPLGADFLASASTDDLLLGLEGFCAAYESWISIQASRISELGDWERKAAETNLERCRTVMERMSAACSRMGRDSAMRQAFQLANLAMSTQFNWAQEGASRPLVWRPFQLAFLLLASESTIDREHVDRDVMDLLWFPTGGGKTEAYLGLIAMLIFHRRLGGLAESGPGVVAVMRYTLRLLTTQQFSRAVAMIAACEAIRTGLIRTSFDFELKGAHPISIGLWVGDAATPNRRSAAYAALHGAKEVSSPEQLAKCPCCHQDVKWTQQAATSPVCVQCVNSKCLLHGELPVFTVDDDIYEQRPALLIGTVDKFAQIVRNDRTVVLFGAHDGNTPDLIIQDELHLISGPLGTVSGLYESAIDLIFSASGSLPKIIGSTATIRKAEEQVRALFDRRTCQFPPPGIDHQDSGFAVTKPVKEKAEGRRYIGISTAGRSAKFALQAIAGSLLQSASRLPAGAGRDDYWTLLGYFNSLRELGGALVLMQDDVSDSVKLFAAARSEDEREVSNVEELTSRRTQDEILRMLDQLETPCNEEGSVDVVLATNMVSVGVDIARLGLMVVNGQPKTTSEYIQSTSRVGRSDTAGLVVTILNNAKARDRSHFETFAGWHQALYRDVEATSVTPFASRARDRALHAALVAAVRHLVPGMTGQSDVRLSEERRELAEELVHKMVLRAGRIDSEETEVRAELEKLLDDWQARSPQKYWDEFRPSASLLQSAEKAAQKRALGREPGEAWATMNTMRSVEVGSAFRMAERLRKGR